VIALGNFSITEPVAARTAATAVAPTAGVLDWLNTFVNRLAGIAGVRDLPPGHGARGHAALDRQGGPRLALLPRPPRPGGRLMVHWPTRRRVR
jgi:hypothetical protein